jgi:hypothetical protein
MERKVVTFRYDSENKTVLMDFKNNLVLTNDGEAVIIGPNLDVINSDGIVLKAAKECIGEMLALIDLIAEDSITTN